jgi:hypothetical protein
MNIIIGKQNLNGVDGKHIVLELDTLHFLPVDQDVQAYCVVENMPIQQLMQAESMQELHRNLIIKYREREWTYCLSAMDHLVGFWGQELDTFYQSMRDRIQVYQEQDPGANWDWRIPKQVA